jgi:hypothetical protein
MTPLLVLFDFGHRGLADRGRMVYNSLSRSRGNFGNIEIIYLCKFASKLRAILEIFFV